MATYSSGSPAGTNYPTGNWYSDATVDSVEFMDTPGDQFNLLSTVNNGTANPIIGYATDGTNPGVNMALFAGITDFKQIDSTLHGFWKLDDSRSDTTVKDSSSYAHNGTLAPSTSLWTTAGNMNDGIALTGRHQRLGIGGLLLGNRRLLVLRVGQSDRH